MRSQTDIAKSVSAARDDWGLSSRELARLANVSEGAVRAATQRYRARRQRLEADGQAGLESLVARFGGGDRR